MEFGLPAIAGGDGAAHEIITEGLDGFLVPGDDMAALRHHLQTLGQNRHKLATMSLAAHNRFATQPTWHQSMTKIHRFLHDCAGRKKEDGASGEDTPS